MLGSPVLLLGVHPMVDGPVAKMPITSDDHIPLVGIPSYISPSSYQMVCDIVGP